jgi:hypothetical protein
MNVLMGEEFYIKYYPKIYKHYDSLLTSPVKASLEELKKYKNKRGMILSAFLCNAFYQLPDSSLADVLESIKNKSGMKRAMSAGNYEVYSDIRKHVVCVLEFLLANDFQKNYNRDIIPLVNRKITTLLPIVNKYNIVSEIERVVGLPLSTDTLKFYLMRYSSPHGISINNTQFLSEVSYDVSITMKVAIHEMMHPYFNIFPDDVKKAIAQLKKDSLVYYTFINHDKSFGYNDFEGYIAEACVRALEQLISQRLGVSDGDNEHWKTEDEGMHVFGAILMQEMKTQKFPEQFTGNFMDLLLAAIADVRLYGGRHLYNKLYDLKNRNSFR